MTDWSVIMWCDFAVLQVRLSRDHPQHFFQMRRHRRALAVASSDGDDRRGTDCHQHSALFANRSNSVSGLRAPTQGAAPGDSTAQTTVDGMIALLPIAALFVGFLHFRLTAFKTSFSAWFRFISPGRSTSSACLSLPISRMQCGCPRSVYSDLAAIRHPDFDRGRSIFAGGAVCLRSPYKAGRSQFVRYHVGCGIGLFRRRPVQSLCAASLRRAIVLATRISAVSEALEQLSFRVGLWGYRPISISILTSGPFLNNDSRRRSADSIVMTLC